MDFSELHSDFARIDQSVAEGPAQLYVKTCETVLQGLQSPQGSCTVVRPATKAVLKRADTPQQFDDHGKWFVVLAGTMLLTHGADIATCRRGSINYIPPQTPHARWTPDHAVVLVLFHRAKGVAMQVIELTKVDPHPPRSFFCGNSRSILPP